MAKKSKIAKEQKIEAMVQKYAQRRQELRKIMTIKLLASFHATLRLPESIAATCLMADHMPICVNLECHVSGFEN